MPRVARKYIQADYYHVLNRGQLRQQLFAKPADYQVFLSLLGIAPNGPQVPILGYCIMPNHWHLVVTPVSQPALSAYLHWVSGTHALQWNRSRKRTGLGHVYQARFKAFPIRYERHLLTVLRYVEANPVRAGLVGHAADWPWSSASPQSAAAVRLAAWPMPKPASWHALLDGEMDYRELDEVREAARSGCELDAPVRPRGRPKKGDGPHFTRPVE
jgi:putative transposase